MTQIFQIITQQKNHLHTKMIVTEKFLQMIRIPKGILNIKYHDTGLIVECFIAQIKKLKK